MFVKPLITLFLLTSVIFFNSNPSHCANTNKVQSSTFLKIAQNVSPEEEIIASTHNRPAKKINDVSEMVEMDGEKNSVPASPAVKLNMKQGLMMNQLLGVYALTDAGNELCRNHSQEFAAGLRAFQPWALKMFDSSSKLQSGVLSGNLMEFGSFKQCLQIYQDTKYGVVRGKQCTIRIIPALQLIKKILSYRNITSKRFVKVYTFVTNSALVWAVCVPDSCSAEDVLNHYDKLVFGLTEGLNLSISTAESDCGTILDDKKLDRMELMILGAFGIFFIVIAVSTVVDLYSTPEEVETNNFVKIFSFYSNSKQIFAPSKSIRTDLDCVNGIRFLSTCYVVIGHRYLMMMFFPVINSLEIMDWVLYYRSTVITGGTLCVDTFFMISGMLVSIGYFNQVAKSKINWVMFYVYRYLRITPPLAVVVLWYSTLIQHLGSGPLWHDMLEIVQKPCQEYWWSTVLHIQNYVHPFPLCLTQAWYLTCDMQYYFLSPLVLVPLSKWPVLGYINYCVIYVLSIAINFYLAWINKYDGGVPVTNQLFSTKYFQHHYIAPHTRAATYIIGLGLGYSIHKTRDSKLKISYLGVMVGWLVCFATMVASLVGCHAFHMEEHDYNRLEAAIYLSCSRSAWTFGILWIVWACINGYGGPINSILSSHVLKVLARISYGIYLLHMLMQYLTSGADKMPGYFSDFSALYASFSDLFIMIIVGFIFTVCFESPLVTCLNLLVKNGSRQKIGPTIQRVKPLPS